MKVLTITAYETVVYEKDFEIPKAVYQEAVKRLNHKVSNKLGVMMIVYSW